jgi:DNA-binding GntR family transcriptional regulator
MAIEQDDPRHAYLQIADDLRTAIAQGELAPGSQLPSTSELTDRYGVAAMTVRNALRVLRDEGLVVARQGSGVFVRSTYSPDDGAEAVSLGMVMERIDAVADELQRLAERVAEVERSTQSRQQPRSKRQGT